MDRGFFQYSTEGLRVQITTFKRLKSGCFGDIVALVGSLTGKEYFPVVHTARGRVRAAYG
jgi:hypothetical protein